MSFATLWSLFKDSVRGWYGDWEDVAVRYAGVATESIYARGRRP